MAGTTTGWIATQAPDEPAAKCLDVGAIRACWPNDGGAPVPTTRTVPALVTSAASWRCHGDQGTRECITRAALSGVFRCERDVCTQRSPDVPDDGIWDCVAPAGAVICMGGQSAAGVTHAPPVRGHWVCGTRRVPPDEVNDPHPFAMRRADAAVGAAVGVGVGVDASAGADAGAARERVCVDLDPDFPEQNATGWRCEYSNRGALQRICRVVAAPAQRSVGSFCSSSAMCAAGTECVQSFCLPTRVPEPECWYDRDCPSGQTCALARCQAGALERRDE